MFTTKTFTLSDEDYDTIKNWYVKHQSYCKNSHKSCCGGELSIEFTPTTIGAFITAKCVCGEKLELDNV